MSDNQIALGDSERRFQDRNGYWYRTLFYPAGTILKNLSVFHVDRWINGKWTAYGSNIVSKT